MFADKSDNFLLRKAFRVFQKLLIYSSFAWKTCKQTRIAINDTDEEGPEDIIKNNL